MPDPSTDPDTGMTHPSDSAVQRRAEQRILELAGQLLGVQLTHRPRAEANTTLPGGAHVDVDGYCPDPLIYAEVFARQGTLKPGQVHKVAQDVLKLVTIRRCLAPTARLYAVFADEAAAATLRGAGWLAEAARVWEVETVVVDLDPPLRLELQRAQQRQCMTTPRRGLLEGPPGRTGGPSGISAGRRRASAGQTASPGDVGSGAGEPTLRSALPRAGWGGAAGCPEPGRAGPRPVKAALAPLR